MDFKKLALLSVLLGLSGGFQAEAATIYAVGSAEKLVIFDSNTPSVVQTMPLIGLGVGESVKGLDFNPTDQKLYALAITNTAGPDEGRIYTLNPDTAELILVGATPFSTTLTDASFYGFDFNPVTNRLRIVNDADQNLRVNPLTGALVATDTNLNPADPAVVAVAYDRNVSGASATTLFGIDSASDKLVLVGGVDGAPSANGGTLTEVGVLGVDTSAVVGFDIDADGAAFASLTVGGVPGLYTINLSTGAATLIGAIAAGPTSISDIATVPSAGSLAFDAAVANVSEGDGSVVVTVKRSGGSFGSVSVDYTTADETAFAGSDYAFTSGTLSFATGESEKTITVPVFDNADADGNRRFHLTLSDAKGGAALGSVASSEITITDDESPQPGAVQFALSQVLINEDGGEALLLISRTGGSSGEVSVTVASADDTAKAGSDYTSVEEIITFGDGDTENKFVSVSITDDENEEPNETLELVLSNPSGGALLGALNTATVTILDDEKAAGGGCSLIR